VGRERERDGAPDAVRHWAGDAQPPRSDRTHVGPRGVTPPSGSVPVGKFPGRMLLSDGDLRSLKSSPLPNRYTLLRLLLLRRPPDLDMSPGHVHPPRRRRPTFWPLRRAPSGPTGRPRQAADKSGRLGGRDCGHCERRESREVSPGQRADRGRDEPSTGCGLPRCRPARLTIRRRQSRSARNDDGAGLDRFFVDHAEASCNAMPCPFDHRGA
jgi:hypothetical protein